MRCSLCTPMRRSSVGRLTAGDANGWGERPHRRRQRPAPSTELTGPSVNRRIVYAGKRRPGPSRCKAVKNPESAVETLVVGGGTAGCVVAGRLAAQGREVLLVEAGPDYGPRASGGWPRELLDASELPLTHDWGFRAAASSPDRTVAVDRARVIG